jgi:membrane-associated protease RseP (regulator of RpoE activity)
VFAFAPLVLLSMVLLEAAVYFGARALAGAAFGVAGAWLPFRRVATADGAPLSPWARPAVTLAGPVATYLLASMLIAASALIGGRTESDTSIGVAEGGPAAAAGLQDGDRIVRMNGAEVRTFDELSAVVRAHEGRPIEIVVDRGGAAQTFSVTPEGGGTGQPRIGVTARGTRHIDVGVGEALVRGVLEPARVVASFVETLSGQEEGELAGPIGLVGSAAKAVRAKPVADLLLFAGLIMSTWWLGGVLAAVAFGLLGWRVRPLTSSTER